LSTIGDHPEIMKALFAYGDALLAAQESEFAEDGPDVVAAKQRHADAAADVVKTMALAIMKEESH
jgi:hypothetical protein